MDIHFLYFFDGGVRYAPGNRLFFNFDGKASALFLREFLAVAQPVNGFVGIQNHGRRVDGARERSPPRFIDARDEVARIHQHLIVKEIRHAGADGFTVGCHVLSSSDAQKRFVGYPIKAHEGRH